MDHKHLFLWIIVPLVQWLLRIGTRRLVGVHVLTGKYPTSLEVLHRFFFSLRACPIASILTSSLPEFNDEAIVAWGITVMWFLPVSLLLIWIEAKW
jgi:hypothetical protein